MAPPPLQDRDIVLAGPLRTPIGKFGGALTSLTAADLGEQVARASLKAAGVEPADLDEVIFGCARQAGVGPNIARQIAWRCGAPPTVPAFTVNKACGSGLKTITLASQAIRSGDAAIVLAGGTESMSRVPFLVDDARWGKKMGDVTLTDGMYRDGFLCPLCGDLMGATAETLADQYRISREDQDSYAARSQNRAEAARKADRFRAEIVPVEIAGRRGAGQVDSDEHPRDSVTVSSLASLRPVFRNGGTVHAGNSSGITDGAAACVVMPLGEARRRTIRPLFRLLGYATAGVEPGIMGIGPVPAIRALVERTGIPLSRFDLVEINEAFASQILACVRELDLDPERLNVNGGAIALGHPIGASGARIVVTLLHEMLRRDARLGLAALCISGGMGIAAAFERI